jgi:signal transduction histidine kinase/DNA-binding response OmpR family regulator
MTGVATTERDITERKQGEVSIREKARELEFLRQGQVALQDKMRGEQDISRLGQNILSHFAQFLGAKMGPFYWLSDDQKLSRVSRYAYSKSQGDEKIIEFGEGLVGQAALEKKPILIEDIPAGYFKISSDLGEAAPRSLLLCPILYEGQVNGVIELGSFDRFTEHQRFFLDHVSENIGIAINTSVSRRKLQELLNKTQVLNEKLQIQQEELKAANEELQEKTRALKESQAKLESQKDVLNQKNEALNEAQVLLEVRAAEVQRASQYKTEFLANMSHELRTPLNSSLILAKLLADNPNENLTDEQVQFASSIYSSGNDLLNLINDILDLSKVEAGKLDIRPENIVLRNILTNLKKTFEPLSIEKKVEFKMEFGAQLPQAMYTDSQRLEQILKNLLSNAFKFTEKGNVKINVSRHGTDQIAFAVADTGIGIPKEQQEVIFEAFRQADGTTNRKYGGTGLGLSISKDLARLLGGNVHGESNPNQGSTFTLILPETYEETQVQAAPIKSYSDIKNPAEKDLGYLRPFKTEVNEYLNAPVRRTPQPKYFEVKDDRQSLIKSRRTILVIEDEPAFSNILYDLAHERGYQCLVARGADEGCELAQEYAPDGILLDIQLPDHTGLSVLDRLKDNSITRHIPVHIVSGHDYTESALQMGAIGYALKPLKRDELKLVFKKLEEKFSQKFRRVLIVEDNLLQRESMCKLIAADDVEIQAVVLAAEALEKIRTTTYDCIIVDLSLPDMSGYKLLEKMSTEKTGTFPPVIVYTGQDLTKDEEQKLRTYSHSIIIKSARSPDRLRDETSLFLHQVEADMPPERRKMLKASRNRDKAFAGRKILIVDDDIRNIFAHTSALEQKGAIIVVGRNGKEAFQKLEVESSIDLVLMHIMMPEMDGYETTREVRKQNRFTKLPIIAVTAKAMRDDQERCLEAGANDYLAKPIDLDKLMSLLRVWMPQSMRAF